VISCNLNRHTLTVTFAVLNLKFGVMKIKQFAQNAALNGNGQTRMQLASHTANMQINVGQ
jgi:hypothetical protein